MSAEIEEIEGDVLPLADARKSKQKKLPAPESVTKDRAAIYLAMEDHVCQLATAAGLAIDIYTAEPVAEAIGPKTAWVLDQIERLTKELKAMYYDKEIEED
jgi:hypothetical protein